MLQKTDSSIVLEVAGLDGNQTTIENNFIQNNLSKFNFFLTIIKIIYLMILRTFYFNFFKFFFFWKEEIINRTKQGNFIYFFNFFN